MRAYAMTAAAAAVAALTVAGCAGKVTPPPTPTEGDLTALASVTRQALETNKTGESSNWTNAASGHRGTVTPLKTYESKSGIPCRDYQQTFTVRTLTQFAYGTACREDDGDWNTMDYSGFAPASRRRYYRDPYYYDYPPYWYYHYPYPYYSRYYGYYGYHRRWHPRSRFGFYYGHYF